MNFIQPLWLLLIIPAALLIWIFALPNRSMRTLRILTYLAVILAIAGVRIKLPGSDGITVIVADRSASMPRDADQSQKEIIKLITAEMSSQHQLAVISFAGEAAIEQPPVHSTFSGFQHKLNPHNSALNNALDLAQQLIPHNTPGKILLLSDGLWSGKDPSTAALRCAGRNISIDYRPMHRPTAGDLHIHQISAPRSVPVNQGFYINAWIGVPSRSSVHYELTRNNQIISSGSRRFTRGIHKLTFRDKPTRSQTADYLLSITSDQPDPLPENNSARFLVSSKGRPSILLLSETPNNGFEKLLSNSGLTINIVPPSPAALELTSLAGMRGVILENVPASKLSQRGMQNLRQWLEIGGRGLLITGGKQSFGAGGYFKSPLDPILPVSMELRKEHRKFAMAIVVVLDRSGSMTAPVAGGKTKMDLANMGTAQVLDLMSDMDELGVIAVDSAPHQIVNLCSAADARSQRGKILNIESMGGGIYVYEGLKAAVRMLNGAQAETRHIILFADAADAEEPGSYKQLLAECRQNKITCSVVALGNHFDSDALLLEDIAKEGGGRSLFTTDPSALPRLFAQDTFAVARSTFLDEPVPFKQTAGYALISGSRSNRESLTLGGYNLCYLRNGAFLAAQTLDEYRAPIIAGWNAGSGRVVAYTGEIDGKYTGAIASWKEYGKMLTSLTRWSAGEFNPLPNGMALRSHIKDGLCRIELWLDPERKSTTLSTPPTVQLLRNTADAPATRSEIPMQWQHADLLTAETLLQGSEVVLPVVSIPGHPPHPLPPVTLPYSAEYNPQQSGKGIETLKNIASMTGGTERLRLDGIWDTLPPRATFKSLQPWMLLLSIILFLLEIIIRRGALPKRFQPKNRPLKTPQPTTPVAKPPLTPNPCEQSEPLTPTPHPAQPEESESTPTSSALKKAATRSKERLRR